MNALNELNKIALKYNYKNWTDMVNNSSINEKTNIFYVEADILLEKAMIELEEYKNSTTAKFKENYKVKTKRK